MGVWGDMGSQVRDRIPGGGGNPSGHSDSQWGLLGRFVRGMGQHGTRVVISRGRSVCHTLGNADVPGQRGSADTEALSLHLAIQEPCPRGGMDRTRQDSSRKSLVLEVLRWDLY